MEDDWDLTAVVRGCSTTTKPRATTSILNPLLSSLFGQHGLLSNYNTSQPQTQTQTQSLCSVLPCVVSDPIRPNKTSPIEELHDLYKSQHNNYSSSLLNSHQPNSFSPHNQLAHKHQPKVSANIPKCVKYHQGISISEAITDAAARKVVWRIERHRSDPGMFIVTYTAEHNHPAPTHRNSLAGSTRLKLAASVSSSLSVTGGGEDSNKPKSPSSSAGEVWRLKKRNRVVMK